MIAGSDALRDAGDRDARFSLPRGTVHTNGRNVPDESRGAEGVRVVIDPDLPVLGQCKADPYGHTVTLRERDAQVLLHEILHILIPGDGTERHPVINLVEVALTPLLPMLAGMRAADIWDEGWNAAVDSGGFPGDANPHRARRDDAT